MADASTNPYLALLQQEAKPPGWAQILQHIGNLGFGLAGGFGQAAATGQPTMNAIGPGLMMGNQLNAQAAHQAEQERMKRLEWQFKAQEHEDKRAELLRNQAAIDAYVKSPGFQVTPTQDPLMGPQPATGDAASRIGGIESGGRYDAVGPVANSAGNRAYGKYQVMDFNIGPWTQEVLGKPMTPQEFLADTKAQDAVFNAKFGAYQQKYGPAGAARAWFAGEGGMNNPNAKDVLGTSVADYERKFTGGRPPAVAQGGGSPPSVPPGSSLSLPQFATLPPFEGPGMSTTQPGATNDPRLVRPPLGDNLPPQVAQGDVTPGGSPVDPNAPPPAFMRPGDPNVVQAQYAPQSGGTPTTGAIEPPPEFKPPPMRDIPPQVNAQINRLVGLPKGVGLTIQQAEEKKHQLRMEQWKVDTATAQAQHNARMEVYKQQQEGRRFDRGQEAQQWRVLDPKNAQMMLGPGYDPTKAYQINAKGQIQPVGGAQTVVNIDQKGEQEFGKKMGEMDAKRFGDIIQAEGQMNDMASKLAFALDQFRQTYTGPQADMANAFFKTLGSVGFEEAANKANAASAAQAVIAQMKPSMRAAGSGTSSDRDMEVFAQALPSLLNLPGGNERITAYFQRLADRATRIRELAQEHSDGGKTPLTRTGFDKAVKELGPLFDPKELEELRDMGKKKKAEGPPPPPSGFTVITPGAAATPPPPPPGFKGVP